MTLFIQGYPLCFIIVVFHTAVTQLLNYTKVENEDEEPVFVLSSSVSPELALNWTHPWVSEPILHEGPFFKSSPCTRVHTCEVSLQSCQLMVGNLDVRLNAGRMTMRGLEWAGLLQNLHPEQRLELHWKRAPLDESIRTQTDARPDPGAQRFPLMGWPWGEHRCSGWNILVDWWSCSTFHTCREHVNVIKLSSFPEAEIPFKALPPIIILSEIQLFIPHMYLSCLRVTEWPLGLHQLVSSRSVLRFSISHGCKSQKSCTSQRNCGFDLSIWIFLLPLAHMETQRSLSN